MGEYHPPIANPINRYSECNNGPSSHRSMFTNTTTVELLLNDTVLGECNPPPPPDPPPPICDTAQTPQIDPIKMHEDDHNEERDKCILKLIVTNIVELLNSGLRGVIPEAEAAAAAPSPPLPSPTLDELPPPTITTSPSGHDMLHDNGLNTHGVTHTDTPTVEQHAGQIERMESEHTLALATPAICDDEQ